MEITLEVAVCIFATYYQLHLYLPEMMIIAVELYAACFTLGPYLYIINIKLNTGYYSATCTDFLFYCARVTV